jgi:hypothetical protein
MKTLSVGVIMLLTIFSTACKKDESKNIDKRLSGTWLSIKPSILVTDAISEYTFSDDGTVENIIYITDTGTGKILGYVSKLLGRYRVVGHNRLQFYDFTNYYNDSSKGRYSPLDQLIASPKVDIPHYYSYQFTPVPTILSLAIECPPNAYCTGSNSYQKK